MTSGARVTLNIDLGEFPDEPEELFALATMVNIACGGHAGDRGSVEHAVDCALRRGASIAAHPSYPDREGFGRRAHSSSGDDLRRSLDEQLSLLADVVRSRGAHVVGVKPHGALYHDASKDYALASTLIEASERAFGRVSIVGPAGGTLEAAATRAGHAFAREGFADRRYGENGVMVPRGRPDALLTLPSEAAAQAVLLARRGDLETLCVHGDTPGAVSIAANVRDALEREGLLATC